MALGYLNVEATEENVKKFDSLFKCKRCGKCCNELKGGVLLSPEEVERLAIPDEYLIVKGDQIFLKLPCPFYKDGCSIYPDRPKVCREFPLNKTYIQNNKIWLTVGMDCPAGKELGDEYAVMVVT